MTLDEAEQKLKALLAKYGVDEPSLADDLCELLEDMRYEGYQDGQDRYWKDNC